MRPWPLSRYENIKYLGAINANHCVAETARESSTFDQQSKIFEVYLVISVNTNKQYVSFG